MSAWRAVGVAALAMAWGCQGESEGGTGGSGAEPDGTNPPAVDTGVPPGPEPDAALPPDPDPDAAAPPDPDAATPPDPDRDTGIPPDPDAAIPPDPDPDAEIPPDPDPDAAIPPDPDAGVPPAPPADSPRETAIRALDAVSVGPVSPLVRDGRLLLLELAVPVDGASPMARALAALDLVGPAFGVTEGGEGFVIGHVTTEEVDAAGESSVVLTRQFEGVELLGADLSVQFRGDTVVQVAGEVDFPAPIEPQWALGPAAVREAALAALDPDAQLIGEARPVYHNADIGRGDGRPRTNAQTRPAWRVYAHGSPGGVAPRSHYEVLIDADTGLPLESTHLGDSCRDDDMDLDVLDAGHSESDTCYLLDSFQVSTCCTEEGCDGGIPDEARTADGHARTIYAWYYDTLCRRGWDGTDGQIEFIVRYGDAWANAAFSPVCDYTIYGENWATLDIMAHEFTHGVTTADADLRYKNDSGALAESLSDTFGALILGASDGSGFQPCHGAIPAIGRNCGRKLDAPGYGGAPAHLDDYWHPDPPLNPFAGPADFGGVHTNCAILSLAAAGLALGGTLHDVPIEALDLLKFTRLWYSVVLHDITRSSGMRSFCIYANRKALRWADEGVYDFTAHDACQVRNACAAIGEGLVDLDCDGAADVGDVDDDGDGTPDADDNCARLKNVFQEDIDGDGLGDACDDDRDGDGVPDADDNCRDHANPDQADRDDDAAGNACDDSDRDGVFDAVDNCWTERNSAQFDRDGDGTGDVCDTDQDGDGVRDETDNCPTLANGLQPDQDRDGRGDACDNCVFVGNPDQQNDDRDRFGNACDDDDDDDGVPDADDNCPTVANADQYDGDGQHGGYACDNQERVAEVIDAWRAGREVIIALGERRDRAPTLPLTITGGDDPRFVDPESRVTVTFETLNWGMDQAVSVVNQFGDTVARAEITRNPDQTVTYTATFSPAANLERIVPGADMPRAVGTRYSVRFANDARAPAELRGTLRVEETGAGAVR
jgi:hypothetical protein